VEGFTRLISDPNCHPLYPDLQPWKPAIGPDFRGPSPVARTHDWSRPKVVDEPDLVWETAQKAGLKDILSPIRTAVEDDHLPFLDAGIPSVDIIDLNFGPQNSYHHTLADTLDKVSPESLEKTGKLVLALLQALNNADAR